MKTLLERLKPELITAIELESEKYPTIMDSLKTQLNTKNYYTELSVSDVLQLMNFVNSEKYSILELVGMFDER